MSIENYLIGSRLQDFRKQAGFSVTKAAESIGVSAAFISMVEHGKCGISIQKARALANLYGRSLADLSATPPQDPRIINQESTNTVASEEGVKIFGLAKQRYAGFQVDGFHLYMEPGAQNDFDYHAGAEYVLILEGTFELSLKETPDAPVETICLRKGDTTTFPSKYFHRYKNIGSKLGAFFVLEISNGAPS